VVIRDVDPAGVWISPALYAQWATHTSAWCEEHRAEIRDRRIDDERLVIGPRSCWIAAEVDGFATVVLAVARGDWSWMDS